ncbi:tyrosine-type recombinase/integrase [Haloferax profundi]|uniref:Integrase n=1 Tax=Haloferax profundi TaxID=1544718 RepID=A0A0W1ST70_9EURY|nr:site-specific integrase [Haloferax profundi]KTG29511.1 integrase [Haloferax profundi]
MDHTEQSVDNSRTEVARAFGRNRDPLAAYEEQFELLAVDAFDIFLQSGLAPTNPAPSTQTAYHRLIEEWKQHMGQHGRHPACPAHHHVEAFVEHCLTTSGLSPSTVRTKLHRLSRIYRYWQADPVFPHGLGYDPFEYVFATTDLSDRPLKSPPRLTPKQLGSYVQTLTDVRNRLIVVLQLKLGLRAGEVSTLRLDNLAVDHPELNAGYPTLGSNPALSGRSRAVYIPSRYEETGNKSHRSRLLPIDDEVYRALLQHLLVRPDTGDPWVFQSRTTATQITTEAINNVWKSVFRPDFDETDNHRAVTSHYGRHRFSTYWQVDHEIPRELVQYMRGDRIDGDDSRRQTIDSYIHTFYEDIEPVYRQNMYSLGLPTSLSSM